MFTKENLGKNKEVKQRGGEYKQANKQQQQQQKTPHRNLITQK